MGLFGPPRTRNATNGSHSDVAPKQQQQQPATAASAADIPVSSRRSASASAASAASAGRKNKAVVAAASSTSQPPPLESVSLAASAPIDSFAASSSSSSPLEPHASSCICTVCTCGRHVCPPTPHLNHYSPSLSSEARQSYTQNPYSPAFRAHAPDVYRPNESKFVEVSTQHAHYPNHGALGRPTRAKPRSMLFDTGVARSTAPFSGLTTNRVDFPRHTLEKKEKNGPKYGNGDGAGEDGRDFSTEGKEKYVQHAIPTRRAKQVEARMQSVPFEGVTTSKSSYAAFPGARPSIPNIRQSGYNPNREDRDFLTESKANLTPKQRISCPAIPVAVTSKSKSGHVLVEMDNMTHTYRRTGQW